MWWGLASGSPLVTDSADSKGQITGTGAVRWDLHKAWPGPQECGAGGDVSSELAVLEGPALQSLAPGMGHSVKGPVPPGLHLKSVPLTPKFLSHINKSSLFFQLSDPKPQSPP